MATLAEGASSDSIESCAVCGDDTATVDGRDVCSNPHCYGRDPALQWHTNPPAKRPLRVTDPAETAAKALADVLRQHRVGRIAVNPGAGGFAVTLLNHPHAFVHFRWDEFGEVQVHCSFDHRPPARVVYDDGDEGTWALATYVVEQVSHKRR